MDQVQLIGRYRIDGTLGTGAMGVVYRAFDTQIQRPVALKTIRKELLSDDTTESLTVRFQNEAKAAGRLIHPNIVTLFDFGEDEETAFIAMELVEGKPLNRLVRRGARAARGHVVNWVSQLLGALEFAHSQGIVHRDIKPGNVLVTAAHQIKITDFGVAKIDSTTMTQVGSIVGTPCYMAPEQFRGENVDGRADVFSAAVILYELLTGSRPFKGSPTAVMHGIMTAVPETPSTVCPDLPPEFDELVLRGLAKERGERYANARDFRKALQAAHAAAPAESESETDPDVTRYVFHSTELDAGHAPHSASAEQAAARSPASRPSAAPPPVSAPVPAAPPSSSGVDGSTSSWDPRLLEDLERALVPQLGPVAGVLVRKIAKKARSLDEFAAAMQQNIPAPTARSACQRAFEGILSRYVDLAAAGSAGGIPSHSGAPGGGLGSNSGIGPSRLQEIERVLTSHVGPIAGVLVRRTVKKASSPQQFYMMLAEHITDAARRARFLREVEGS